MTYSKFVKSPNSKTGYKKIAGDFPAESIYLVEPYFVKRRTPKFSLVAKGRHISGFFPSCLESAFVGDDRKSGLILFQLPGGELELFSLPQKGAQLLEDFCSGQLNETLGSLRDRFSSVKS